MAGSVSTNDCIGPAAVIDGVVGLHTGNNIGGGDTGNFLGAQMLGVLNSHASVPSAVLLRYCIEDIQQAGVGAITNGMNNELQLCRVGGNCPALDVLRRGDKKPTVSRRIAEVFKKCGGVPAPVSR